MKPFLATQVIARQNACRNRGERFGRQVANAIGTLDGLRRFHRRVVLLLFYDSDDEACSAPCFELAWPAKAHLPVIIGPRADGEL